MIKNVNTQQVQVQQLPSGYVVNPSTGKLIKIGSKKYNELFKNNDQQPEVNNQVDEQQPKKKNNIVAQTTSKQKAIQLKNQLTNDKPLPEGQIYALSNGQNQVVVKKKKSPSIKPEEMIDKVSIAVNRVQKKLSGKMDVVDLEDQEQVSLIKQMISQEMLLMNKPQQQQKKSSPKPQQLFKEEENDDDVTDDEEDEEEDDE